MYTFKLRRQSDTNVSIVTQNNQTVKTFDPTSPAAVRDMLDWIDEVKINLLDLVDQAQQEAENGD